MSGQPVQKAHAVGIPLAKPQQLARVDEAVHRVAQAERVVLGAVERFLPQFQKAYAGLAIAAERVEAQAGAGCFERYVRIGGYVVSASQRFQDARRRAAWQQHGRSSGKSHRGYRSALRVCGDGAQLPLKRVRIALEVGNAARVRKRIAIIAVTRAKGKDDVDVQFVHGGSIGFVGASWL